MKVLSHIGHNLLENSEPQRAKKIKIPKLYCLLKLTTYKIYKKDEYFLLNSLLFSHGFFWNFIAMEGLLPAN